MIGTKMAALAGTYAAGAMVSGARFRSREWRAHMLSSLKVSQICPKAVLEHGSGTRSLQTAVEGMPSSKVYVHHTFYKGKCALNMRPMAPTFKQSESGSIFLSREGSLFLEFAPAIAQKQYDWSKKQTFSLSAQELGLLLSLNPSEGCEMFHDPNVGKSDAGMIRKVFKVEPILNDKAAAYFFNLVVVNKVERYEDKLSIPISKSEFAAMRAIFNYLIPYLIGFHALPNAPEVLDASNSLGAGEWGKA